MITKAELEKMVELESEKYAEEKLPPVLQTEYHLIQHENSFKSGCSYVTGILMPEIERVENNCDTLENKAIFWMETNDRAIEHTESLQLTITTLKTEIQSLKDERDNAIKAMDYHINSDMRTQEENQSLKDENEELKSRVEIGLYNLELRTKENKSIIDNQDETKWAYWRKRAGEMTDAWIDQKDLALTLTAKVKLYEKFIKTCVDTYFDIPVEHRLGSKDMKEEDLSLRARAALNQGEEREFFEMQNAKGKFEK